MQASFGELRSEFEERGGREGFKAERLGSAAGADGCVEHVRMSGLPLLGATHASIGGGWIHVAAVLGLRLQAGGQESEGLEPAGLVPGGYTAETYRCCQLIEAVLHGCGSAWSALLRLTLHVTDLTRTKLEAIEEVADLFSKERGCLSITRSALGCARLRHGAVVQIEAIALVPPEGSQAVGGVCPRPLAEPPWPLGQKGEKGRTVSVASTEAPSRWDFGEVVGSCEEEDEDWILSTAESVEASRPVDAAATAAGAEEADAWVVLGPGAPGPAPGPAPAKEEAQAPGPQPLRELGLVGNGRLLRVKALSAEEARSQLSELGLGTTQVASGEERLQHNVFRRLEMLENDQYRTVRLHPEAFACFRPPPPEAKSKAEAKAKAPSHPPSPAAKSSSWSFTFDVVVLRTAQSFLNMGLVEWLPPPSRPWPLRTHLPPPLPPTPTHRWRSSFALAPEPRRPRPPRWRRRRSLWSTRRRTCPRARGR